MEIRIPTNIPDPEPLKKAVKLPKWGGDNGPQYAAVEDDTPLDQNPRLAVEVDPNPPQLDGGLRQTLQHDRTLLHPHLNHNLGIEKKHRLMLWMRSNVFVQCPHCRQTRPVCFCSRPGQPADLGLALCRNPHCEQGFSLYTVRLLNRDGSQLDGLPSWLT